MKLIIASDIHGSATWCERFLQAAQTLKPDRILLLGDLLYHGPRNPLPEGYEPMDVAHMLNALHPAPIAVRGNCDSEVDQMVLNFPCMSTYSEVLDNTCTLFCTHGHEIEPSNPPALQRGDAFLSGHTHIKVNEERDGIHFFNPGSVSIPKDNAHSFGIYEDGRFSFQPL